MIMETIEKLEEERDKICLQKLNDTESDFSEIRSICKSLQETTGYDFKLNGTDNEVLRSVIHFFRDILKAAM